MQICPLCITTLVQVCTHLLKSEDMTAVMKSYNVNGAFSSKKKKKTLTVVHLSMKM